MRLVTRTHLLSCAARNYSARGYVREPASISDTRRDDLNIPQHDATLFRRNRLTGVMNLTREKLAPAANVTCTRDSRDITNMVLDKFGRYGWLKKR